MARLSGAYAGANHQVLKQNNQAAVFRAVRALSPIARVDLARETGLNPGTVTNIVDELIASGLVSETGEGTSRVGRKPIHLGVNPTARYAIGVDITRGSIAGAVVDLAGRVHQRVDEPSGPGATGAAVLGAVSGTVERLLEAMSAHERRLLIGIGVGAPGPLSFRSGRYAAAPAFGTWDDLSLRDEVERCFGLLTFVDNNGNTSALAEWWFGAGQGVDDFVLLTVGTGVGGGLMLGGDLYRGGHDLAGELGHLSINADGPRCACGNHGCLELYVSVPRVLASVQAALATGEPSLLRSTNQSAGDALSLAALVQAARQDDAVASRVLHDFARSLAAGIVTLVNLFDPQLVLLGRELATADDALLDLVRGEVRRRLIPTLADQVRVERAALPDAPVVGAATLTLTEFFAAPLAARRQAAA